LLPSVSDDAESAKNVLCVIMTACAAPAASKEPAATAAA
jgi:hypothetical protein